jgi:hypothetical protein
MELAINIDDLDVRGRSLRRGGESANRHVTSRLGGALI